MDQPVLVPTDGSPAAETALETALVFARQFDVPVHVVHVLESGRIPVRLSDRTDETLTTHGTDLLASVETTLADVDVTVFTELVESERSIHQSILAYGNEHRVGLVVMGTHGRHGLKEHVLGSVTERTLRISSIPVLTVTEHTHISGRIDRILHPTDLSTEPSPETEYAISLAESFDAALHVVHAVELIGYWNQTEGTTVLEALNEAGSRAVDEIVSRVEHAEIPAVEGKVLDGPPARTIVEYANENDIDLIVIGTHGRTGLDRYLLGSTTERVVRLSDVPVLTVSQRGTKRA